MKKQEIVSSFKGRPSWSRNLKKNSKILFPLLCLLSSYLYALVYLPAERDLCPVLLLDF